jgi:Secretion system C-terminal sorting domain
MKTKQHIQFLLLIIIATNLEFAYSQGINNTSGTTITANNNVQIVIENGGFKNDGNFTKSNSTIVFTGTNATNSSFISGITPLDLYNLTLNKTSNGLQLNSNINVTGTVHFQSGDSIFLNNYYVNLGSSGTITGETNNSKFTGYNGGYIMITQNLNGPASVNPGNLGITITSSSNLGSTIIKRSHVTQRNISVNRSFEIIPTNNAALNASLTFSYFHSELNNNTEPNITLYSSFNNGTSWNLVNHISLNTALDYVTATEVNSVSLFTLFSIGSVLPIQTLSLNSKILNDKILLQWNATNDFDTKLFEIERSMNGVDFQKIGIINDIESNSNVYTYQYTDDRAKQGINYYRLKQIDHHEFSIYSPVIKVILTDKVEIKLSPNPAKNMLNIKVTENEPELKTVTITDLNGKIYTKKFITCVRGENNFSFSIDELPEGNYFIHVLGKTKQTVSFIKL